MCTARLHARPGSVARVHAARGSHSSTPDNPVNQARWSDSSRPSPSTQSELEYNTFWHLAICAMLGAVQTSDVTQRQQGPCRLHSIQGWKLKSLTPILLSESNVLWQCLKHRGKRACRRGAPFELLLKVNVVLSSVTSLLATTSTAWPCHDSRENDESWMTTVALDSSIVAPGRS